VLKRAIAAALVVSLLAPPRTARAAEPDAEEAPRVQASPTEEASPNEEALNGEAAPPIMLHRYDVLARSSPLPLVAPAPQLLAPVKMNEIRLTHSEKVIIIVCAVVVGVIIIVFAVGKPHKHW
jgi:hypothetical protein